MPFNLLSLGSLLNLGDRLREGDRSSTLFSLGDLLDPTEQVLGFKTLRSADLGLGMCWLCWERNLGDLRGVVDSLLAKEFLLSDIFLNT